MKKIIYKNPIDGIKPTIDCFHFYGIWPYKNSSIFYKIYMFINVFTFAVFYIGTLLGSLFKMIDLEHSIEAVYISFSDLALGIKLAILLMRRKKIENLIDTMKKDLYVDSEDDEEKKIISNGISNGRQIFYFVKYLFIFAVLLASLVPLFQNDRTLLFPSVFPFDPKKTQAIYLLTLAFQIVGIFIQVQWDAGLDTIPSSILSILSGYYDALGYNLRKIGWSFKEEGDKQRIDLVKTKSEHDHERKTLNILIVKYMKITRIANMIEDMFAEMMFTQFCLGGLIICTAAFQLSILSFRADFVQCIFSLTFIFAMTCEIFLPCYYGNEIMLKSENLLSQLYHSNWLQGSHKIRMDIYRLMECLKRSKRISVGRIFFVSLQSFTSIMNFAYSSYTVLRRVHTPKI